MRLKYWEDRRIVRNKFFFHCTKLLGNKQCRFQSNTKQSGIVELNSLWDTKVISQCCFKTGSWKQGPVTKRNQTKPKKKTQSFPFPMEKDLWKGEWASLYWVISIYQVPLSFMNLGWIESTIWSSVKMVDAESMKPENKWTTQLKHIKPNTSDMIVKRFCQSKRIQCF